MRRYSAQACQGWLWVQGLPNRELDFVRALFALQQNIAANAVHPPNTKPVTDRPLDSAPAVRRLSGAAEP